MKKSSTLKSMMNISFVSSICIQRSIILIFIEKKVCLSIFFPQNIYFSAIFDFHFCESPCFRDEFQALNKGSTCTVGSCPIQSGNFHTLACQVFFSLLWGVVCWLLNVPATC